MDVLHCHPSVFVIKDEYEILVITEKNSLCHIEIGNRKYYEANTGLFFSERPQHKIRVPQHELDAARAYTVVTRVSVDRKAYLSDFAPEVRTDYVFRPLTKTEDIHVFHIADVHYQFAIAEKMCAFVMDKTDLLLVNGDIGEVETVDNLIEIAAFVGNLAKGELPIIFTRGNHDCRGKHAENYADFFPADGVNVYFPFSVGCISGVVFDCGEDKVDDLFENGRYVYDGYNAFHEYRVKETAFLQNLTLPEDGYRLAIGHIAPVYTTEVLGCVFDIERDTYAVWSREFTRMRIDLMIAGHMHRKNVLFPGDPRSTLPHTFPLVIGSDCRFKEGNFACSYMTLNKNNVHVVFIDNNGVESTPTDIPLNRKQ